VKLLPAIKQLSIVDKSLQTRRLGEVLNWAHLELIRTVEREMALGKPVRIIILKARQMGLSTAVEAILFTMAFVLDRMRSMIIAHDIPSSQGLLGMTEFYWDTYPYHDLFTPKYRSQKHLEWIETHSSIKVQTAANTKAGRSSTLQGIHASEVAFYDKAHELMAGLLQAMPNLPETMLFLESTANGVGNYFHQTWLMAEAGQNDFIPLFFPWYKHPEYVMPVFRPLGVLDEEERVLTRFFGMLGMEDGEIEQRLTWRRYVIRNDLRNDLLLFHQEYPTTPEEAFLSTGKNVFPASHLKHCYRPMEGLKGRLVNDNGTMRFQRDIFGELTIFREPSDDTDWGRYVVSGDPTRTTEGDYAVAQVINRRTWEQVAVLRLRCDPNTFGERLMDLAKWYNMALINAEITGPGYATIAVIIKSNYPHLWQRQLADQMDGTFTTRWGWNSTAQTKPEYVGNLLKAVVDHAVTIHDAQTFHEMINYVDLGGGEYGNSVDGEFDDTVSSLGIGLTTVMYEATSLQAYGSQTGGEHVLVGADGQPMKSDPDWMSWGET
jgi:hypothetical protein